MNAAIEFPGSCSTNTYILHDFGEVAYIVCTLAASTSTSGNGPSPSPDITLQHLQKTEHQFRQASILAALDVDTLQLFTFYKKVDVLKDQRTLLSKFGYVLRSNACTIAYKATARVPDLLKQENARLYRLFVAAVLASVKILPSGDHSTQSLGTRFTLVRNLSSAADHFTQGTRIWSLYRTDLQVILTGQVILRLSTDSSLGLACIADIAEEIQFYQHLTIPVIIAPSGQALVYKGGWIGRAADVSQKAWMFDQMASSRWHIWHDVVCNWFQSEEHAHLDDENELWIELQVPAIDENAALQSTEVIDLTDSKKKPSLMWKTIYWPARKCFTDYPSLVDQIDATKSDKVQDPLQFIEAWARAAVERAVETVQTEKLDTDGNDEEDDDLLFSEEGPFDNPEHFQPFGPPIFPNSQTVYPTPPDVVMTHATPGMLSVDGLAMTPATASRPGLELQQQQHSEQDTNDFEPGHARDVGSGFYDEDLFEEMPDDNFGHEGAGDEPNWDFFDEPDIEIGSSGALGPDNLDIPSKPKTRRRSSGIRIAASDSNKTTRRQSTEKQNNSIPKLPLIVHATTPGGDHQLSDTLQKRPSSPEAGNQAIPTDDLDMDTVDKSVAEQQNFSPRDQQTARRRPSIYDGMIPASSLAQNTRYSANGEFFFDSNPEAFKARRAQHLGGWVRKSSSSSSTDSDASSEDDMSIDNDPLDMHSTQLWAEYDLDTPEATSPIIDIHNEPMREDALRVFQSLRRRMVSFPSSSAFRFFMMPRGDGKNDPESIAMTAQILVDQVLQSTTTCLFDTHGLGDRDNRKRQDLNVDFTNINPTTTYATVSQLCTVKSANTPIIQSGGLTKLQQSQISVRRADQRLLLSASVLPFWDTLGLQPLFDTKNVVSFCLHPSEDGNDDASKNLLARIADAYASCNLGVHTQGRLAGLCNDGFLPFDSVPSNGRTLVQTAKRLGTALATASDLHGNIVIYMVGQSNKSSAYLECCSAFCTLFQSFMQARGSRTEEMELVLQVIPLTMLVSNEAPRLPSQLDYFFLALEVYNRLPPANDQRAPATWEYAIALSGEGNKVHFNLAANSQSPFSKHGPCLHVSYQTTEDERWLVAVWTDETGSLSLTMTYSMAKGSSKHESRRQEVMKDIWDVSQDIMKKHRNQWRLIVARVGSYEPYEVNNWLHIVNGGSAETPNACSLYLIAVELDPSLKILPHSSLGKAAAIGYPIAQSNLYGTPASTPQASTTSPEQLVPATPTPGGTSAVNAPTPPDQGFDPSTESDLSLMDPSTESWAVMLPFGINQSANIFENRAALASGYLVKRMGIKDEDGVTMMGVHLTHMPTNLPGFTPVPKEEILEDVIGQYRALAVLAITRGSIDAVQDCVPWHIASTVKGARILGEVL